MMIESHKPAAKQKPGTVVRDKRFIMSFFKDLKLPRLDIRAIEPNVQKFVNLTELSLTGNRCAERFSFAQPNLLRCSA